MLAECLRRVIIITTERKKVILGVDVVFQITELYVYQVVLMTRLQFFLTPEIVTELFK